MYRQNQCRRATLSSILTCTLIQISGALTLPFNFRGFYRLSKQFGRIATEDEKCIAKLNSDSQFEFYLADPYWNQLLFPKYRYEPEIERTLRSLKDMKYEFMDLGANYGYWSVLASSTEFGAQYCVAIEPAQRNYEILENNLSHNQRRFKARQLAISDKSNEIVTLHLDPHSISNVGANIIDNQCALPADLYSESVETISIDDLYTQEFVRDRPVVIKLDVEGKEIDALDGGKDILTNIDVMLIYEDHGSDRECRVSDYILANGLSVYHLENQDVRAIRRIEDVKEIKKQATKGYNLFAARRGSRMDDILKNNLV